MLVLTLNPGQTLYLPTPDAREIVVAGAAKPKHSVLFAIPTLHAGDRVDVRLGGETYTVHGAEWINAATRVALEIPDQCRVRHAPLETKSQPGARP